MATRLLKTLFFATDYRNMKIYFLRVLLFIFTIIFLQTDTIETFAAPAAGVNQSTWQDNDRNHRRSPSQIKTQLRTPQVRSGESILNPGAMDTRQAKVKNTIAAGEAQLPAAEALPMLEEGDWRLRILPAAVTNTEQVRLGDIAVPIGHIDPITWEQLANRELWPAPPEEGKPLQINKTRLSQALRESLGSEYSGRCLLPTSLVIQKGGAVFREDDLRNYVVNSLAPQLQAMPGEAELTEFRLPEYIFLAHNQQQIQLEPGKLSPGRISLKFAIQDADGQPVRKVAGTAKLTLWITAPAAARPINKGETLTPEAITFMRMNAGQMKDVPWDGQGGPWQAARSIATGEPILQSDLANKLMVRKGNILTLIFERGNLHMSLQAEALSDGQPGQTIPVRNLQTKKQIYATVQDAGTVIIR